MVETTRISPGMGFHDRQVHDRSRVVVLPVLAASIFQFSIWDRSVTHRTPSGYRLCSVHNRKHLWGLVTEGVHPAGHEHQVSAFGNNAYLCLLCPASRHGGKFEVGVGCSWVAFT